MHKTKLSTDIETDQAVDALADGDGLVRFKPGRIYCEFCCRVCLKLRKGERLYPGLSELEMPPTRS
jgi:hypothetical protein